MFCSAPNTPTIFGAYLEAPLTDFEEQVQGFNAIRNERINATQRIVCYNQLVYDDMRLELTEYAGLTLAVGRSTVRAEVRPMYDQVAIEIVDDDSKCTHRMYNEVYSKSYLFSVAVVSLESVFQEIGEDQGVVEVCVIVSLPDIECPVQFPFTITLSTSDVSAGQQFKQPFDAKSYNGALE